MTNDPSSQRRCGLPPRLALTAFYLFVIVPPRVRTASELAEAMSMTQMKNWQLIYALTLVLIVSSACAEEKKPVTGKPGDCPKCCKTAQAPACSECCKECPRSCNSPSSSKLVTRIHPLATLFEAMEQMEAEEGPVSRWSSTCSAKRNLQEQIIKLITNHIHPDSWSNLAGQGTLEYYPLGKALIVSQKAETQEQIAKFLEDLRALVDTEACEAEEAAPQCLPPSAMAGMPIYCWPMPLDMPVERIMIERPMAQPPYAYAPAQPVYAAPPVPVARLYVPPEASLMDSLQARTPFTEVLPAPRPAMTMPAPVAQCVATQPVQCQSCGWVMRARCDGDKTQLEMDNGTGTFASCQSMELGLTSSHSLKLTAQQNQVHIDGNGLRAMADSLKCMGRGDWTLEGHVMLTYKKDGTSAQVRGDRLVLSLKDGQMEFKFTGNSQSIS